MHCLKYRITTLSSVLIAKSSGERNIVKTFDYIPGTSILGIFANKFISKSSLTNPHTDGTFHDWFLNNKIYFTNAYITFKDEVGKYYNNFPSPISIQEEKDNEQEIHDLLFSTPVEQTKPIRGYCRISGDGLYKQNVSTSLNFHPARDKQTGSSKEGVIFNYESIDKNQTFEGIIISEENILKNFYSKFNNENEFNIGRSRNSQYGKIKFEFISKTPEECISEIPAHRLDENNFEDGVSLTFLSDVILYDKYGSSAADINTLNEYLKEKISSKIEITKAFVKPGFVENYVSVWKLKKPAETCFQAGSCFLVSNIKKEVLDKLRELQINGIGERRSEGFGRIVFGWQTKDKFSLMKKNDLRIDIPTTPVPDLTKKAITKVIQNLIIREMKVIAITDAATFMNYTINKNTFVNSKSLISRLESFIKGSENQNQFNDKLKQLRDTALDKLNRCRMGNVDFYEYLKKKEVSSNDVIKENKYVHLKDEIVTKIYKPEEDREFNNQLYRIYFLTFFSSLRKLIKQVKEEKQNV